MLFLESPKVASSEKYEAPMSYASFVREFREYKKTEPKSEASEEFGEEEKLEKANVKHVPEKKFNVTGYVRPYHFSTVLDKEGKTPKEPYK